MSKFSELEVSFTFLLLRMNRFHTCRSAENYTRIFLLFSLTDPTASSNEPTHFKPVTSVALLQEPDSERAEEEGV